MAAKAAIHTVPVKDGPGWENQQGGRRVGGTHRTQSDAIADGRTAARRDRTEHVIHGRNGQIRARSSYGNDPRSRPG